MTEDHITAFIMREFELNGKARVLSSRLIRQFHLPHVDIIAGDRSGVLGTSIILNLNFPILLYILDVD